MKIVSFRDGTFGVRKGFCPWYYTFLGKDTLLFDHAIGQHCKVKSVAEARELVAAYIVKVQIAMHPMDYGTPIYEPGRRK